MSWSSRTVGSADEILHWWRDDGWTGAAALAWLGQAGFLLRLGPARIVIDPYLSDSLAEKYRGQRFPHVRMMPPPVAAEDLDGVDLLLSTHEHTDHLDPGTVSTVLAASPAARAVVTRYSTLKAVDCGIPSTRQIALSVDEMYRDRTGVSITALPAAHEEYVVDEYENAKFLGYLIEFGGIAIYHSGDTIPFSMLEQRLANHRIDLALLPANGRDEVRLAAGIAGNFTAEEALAYHERFGFGTTVLHHFGMFDFNTVDSGELRAIIDSHRLSSSVIISETGLIYEYEK